MSKEIRQKNHAFNIAIAKRYGIEEAILLQNISFWIDHNKANDKNYHDGKHWTYNSIKAFHKLFSYMSEYKIQRVLKDLEDEGILVTGNYNKSNYDRTKWYALSKEGEKLMSNPEKYEETPESQQSVNSTNGDSENAESKKTKCTMDDSEIDQPIPDINSDINPVINNNKKEVVVSQNTIEKIKEKTKNHLVKENIETIIKQTGATEEELLTMVELMTNSTSTINNPIGWLIKAIKNGYKVAKSVKFKSNNTKNSFHNFQTSNNNYTNDELLDILGITG